ncbi:hypothetical protein [Bacillus sp. 2205SS5-2]|uniref:hypothetical protein n=1 Tax=Bacillus sp. 2205SS5-2 TaxID=3109031 RepID=UPI0030067400
MILHSERLGLGNPLVFFHTGLQTGLSDFIDQREPLDVQLEFGLHAIECDSP